MYVDAGYVVPRVNDPTQAAANVSAIQAALNAGGKVRLVGSGVAYINAPLVIGSNTSLTVDPAMTLRQANNTNSNLIQSKAYNNGSPLLTSVTISWTSGALATVAWPSHGLVIDDPILIKGQDGTTDGAFIGVFSISSVPDANNVVVKLERLPSVAPAGTIQALKVDRNIAIQGGTWDYNVSNNSTGSGSIFHIAVMYGVDRLNINDVYGVNLNKYLLGIGGVRNFNIGNLRADSSATGDILKIYGPAFHGVAAGISGHSYDDCVSVQPREPAAFAAYDITGGGDCLNIEINGLNAISETQSVFAAYAHNWFKINNLVLGRIAGDAASPIKFTSNAGMSGTTIDKVKLQNCVRRRDNDQPVITFTGSLTVGLIEFDGFSTFLNATTQVGASQLFVDSTVTVRELVARGLYGVLGDSEQYLSINGTVDAIFVSGGSLSASNLGEIVAINPTASIRKLRIEGMRTKGLADLVRIYSGNTSNPSIDFVGNFIDGKVGLNAQSSCKVNFNDNACINMVNGLLRTDSRFNSVTVPVTASGNDVDTAGSLGSASVWLTKVSGTEVIQPYSQQFQADVTTVARVNGGTLFNTNTAAGTLGSAGVIDCLGTAANSWKLRGSNSLAY